MEICSECSTISRGKRATNEIERQPDRYDTVWATFVIAHRLTTVLSADQIRVLEV